MTTNPYLYPAWPHLLQIKRKTMKYVLKVLHLCKGNLRKMVMGPQKWTLRWKFFMRKSQSKSLRKVMVRNHPNMQHAFVSAREFLIFVLLSYFPWALIILISTTNLQLILTNSCSCMPLVDLFKFLRLYQVSHVWYWMCDGTLPNISLKLQWWLS